MKVRKLKNGDMKITTELFTAVFRSKTQQLVYDDRFFVFGVYLGKWRRLDTQFKKLQFVRDVLFKLHNDEHSSELGATYRSSETVVKAFDLLSSNYNTEKESK